MLNLPIKKGASFDAPFLFPKELLFNHSYCGLLEGFALFWSAFFAPLQVSDSESTFSTVNCFSEEPPLFDISEVVEAGAEAPLDQSPWTATSWFAYCDRSAEPVRAISLPLFSRSI